MAGHRRTRRLIMSEDLVRRLRAWAELNGDDLFIEAADEIEWMRSKNDSVALLKATRAVADRNSEILKLKDEIRGLQETVIGLQKTIDAIVPEEGMVDVTLPRETVEKMIGPWYLIKKPMADEFRKACKDALCLS
jgi:hypothetical protein